MLLAGLYLLDNSTTALGVDHRCLGTCPPTHFASAADGTCQKVRWCGTGQVEKRAPTTVTDRVCTSADNSSATWGAVFGVLVAVLLCAFVGFKRHAHNLTMKAVDFKSELEQLLAAGELSEGTIDRELIPREIKRSCVSLTSKIGSGQFGDVFKAMLDESSSHRGPPAYMVAVKTIKARPCPLARVFCLLLLAPQCSGFVAGWLW
jgi:hypothetical protein